MLSATEEIVPRPTPQPYDATQCPTCKCWVGFSSDTKRLQSHINPETQSPCIGSEQRISATATIERMDQFALS